MRSLIVCLMVLLFPSGQFLEAQGSDRSGGFDMTIQALWSQVSESGFKHSAPAFDLGAAYVFPIGLAIELRTSYRYWDSRDTKLHAPLLLGMRYDLPVNNRLTLSPFAGIGPSLNIGGDAWGAIFAAYELGLRVFIPIRPNSKTRFSLQAAYGKALAFHPHGNLTVLNFGGGLNFEL